MESYNRSVKTRIERLICEIPSNEQNIQEEYYQEIEELNKEIRELNLGNLKKELNIDILEENSKKNHFPTHVEILKNVYSSFIQDLKPFYDRLDQLSNDKKQTNVQHKLNDKFLKKLDLLKKKFEEELREKNEKQLQNYTEEEMNKDFNVKSKENETEVQEDSDVEIEEFEEEMQDHSEIANNEHFEEVHENSKFKIGALEKAIIVDSEVKIEYSENEQQEDSDVDIEGFEGEILEFPEVKIDDFYEESQENTDLDTEDLSDEEFNDINEVIEIVEDIEVESYYSIDDYISSDKIPTSTNNEFNLKMDPNSKLTYNEEENLKISSEPTIFTEHIKEKQIFSELKHQLDELYQEYKGYVQKKVFKELEQEIDDKQLQEMEKFPNTVNEKDLKTDKDFQKEIDELQNEWCQLKPEFMSDVPLSFVYDKSSKKLKKKTIQFV
ncbi:myosin-J heavy chain-like [Acyrthosiphon pisum]|uniref:Uncharacterized protein n=1 Tax=Acyrthosiphon pisum TaxID=7029 RepID=A0A8R2JL35_ACYPI|nr:myosin-J heavy chain-like [Acyrthosiphon pisum]